MKIKKSWIAVVLILVAGIWVTRSTRQYISMSELEPSDTYAAGRQAAYGEGYAPETAAAPAVFPAAAGDADAAGSGMGSGAGSGISAGSGAAAEPAAGRSAALPAEAAIRRDGDAAAPARDSTGQDNIGQDSAGQDSAGRDKAAGPGSDGPVLEETAAESQSVIRLRELDEQIDKSHQSSQDTTTNSLKATAESERKLWETELKRILDILEDKLSDDAREALFQEQKAWIQDREKQAVEDSKKQGGSALEELEYNISLRDSTRLRAYELAERYADVISGER